MNEFRAKAQHMLFQVFHKILGGVCLVSFIRITGILLPSILKTVSGMFADGYVSLAGGEVPQLIAKVFVMGLAVYALVPSIINLFEPSFSVALSAEGIICKYPIRGTKLRRWEEFKTITICWKLYGTGSQLIYKPVISCFYLVADKGLWRMGMPGGSGQKFCIYCDEDFIQELKRLRPNGVYDARITSGVITS